MDFNKACAADELDNCGTIGCTCEALWLCSSQHCLWSVLKIFVTLRPHPKVFDDPVTTLWPQSHPLIWGILEWPPLGDELKWLLNKGREGGKHIFGSCDISLKNTPTSHAVRLCLCAHAVILWFSFCHALAYAITANCACLHLLGPSSCSGNSIAIWRTGIHAYIHLYITILLEVFLFVCLFVCFVFLLGGRGDTSAS